MSIDTLKFVKEATQNGFSEKQAEFLSNEIYSKKVGNDYLDERLTMFAIDLTNKITIKIGGLMIIWTTISLTFLGFILKH
jgi:hypothetical protein